MVKQERLGGGEVLRRISLRPPSGTDDKGADKASEIERAPGFEPGDGGHAGV